MFTIQKAAPADFDAVYDMMCMLEEEKIDKQAMLQVYLQQLQNPYCFYFIARKNESIIGFASMHVQMLLHHAGPVGEIQEFFVDERYRGKGLGGALMHAIESAARQCHCLSLEVTANKKRKDAHIFYQARGFHPTHIKFVKPL